MAALARRRRRSSGGGKAERKLAAANSRNRSLRKKFTGRGAAVRNSGFFLGGAALSGLVEAMTDGEIMGIDSDQFLAVATGAIGLWNDDARLIYAAAGALASEAKEYGYGLAAGEIVPEAVSGVIGGAE